MSGPDSSEILWTTRKLLAWTAPYLQSKQVDSHRLVAELLLAHVLETDRIHLYTDLDRPTVDRERAAYRSLVERAAAHEPVQYLVGEAHFYSLAFAVGPDVLIPRPSTETLLEHIIQRGRHTPGLASPMIADVGTGSGCIAVALAKNLPEAHVVATDICPKALAMAQENARRHGVADRIEFRLGSLDEPLNGQQFHFLVSNPPYISNLEWAQVPPNVREHEPALALRGGLDGLDLVRPLVERAAQYLADPGQLVLEIAASQQEPVLELVRGTPGLVQGRVLADHEGLPRMLLADRKET